MPGHLQTFVVHATEKAARDLESALRRLPEDKWAWSAGGRARTAIDQVAECALVNAGFAKVIARRAWPEDYSMEKFGQEHAQLTADPARAVTLLKEETDSLVIAIAGVSDEELGHEVRMAWGPMTLDHMITHGYWNMSYHEAQINYIGAILGVEAE